MNHAVKVFCLDEAGFEACKPGKYRAAQNNDDRTRHLRGKKEITPGVESEPNDYTGKHPRETEDRSPEGWRQEIHKGSNEHI